MSQRIVHVVTCDLSHDDPDAVTAAETVRLSLIDRAVEVDLCAAHASELFGDLEEYMTAGRSSRRQRPGR